VLIKNENLWDHMPFVVFFSCGDYTEASWFHQENLDKLVFYVCYLNKCLERSRVGWNTTSQQLQHIFVQWVDFVIKIWVCWKGYLRSWQCVWYRLFWSKIFSIVESWMSGIWESRRKNWCINHSVYEVSSSMAGVCADPKDDATDDNKMQLRCCLSNSINSWWHIWWIVFSE